MSRTAPGVDLRPDHWAIVCSILRQHVPDREVLAFGSRATWTAKDYSDLDLAIMGDEPLTLDATSALAEGFGESDLPFKVDVVDWAKIDNIFRNIVHRDGVAVQVPRETSKATGPACRSLPTSGESIEEASQLGICAEIVMGQSPPGNTTNTSGDGVPLLNGPTEFGSHHPEPAQFTTDARKMAYPGDLLFCVRGSTTGRMNWADQEYAIGRGIASLRHKRGQQFQPFVQAVVEFSLPDLLNQATGSTFPNVSARQLATIWWPPLKLSEQRAIAHILGTLDDKIELNRRMNETLEAMARALFKSWFVDFDPVRAKMEGRHTGLPQEIAELFPDRLVESSLRDVPEGWDIESLSKHFEAVKGVSYKGSGLGRGGIPLHNLNSIHEGGGYKYEGIKFYAGKYADRHIVRAGDVIVANTEQGHDRLLIGYAAMVPRLFGEHGIYSHHVYRMRPRNSGRLSTPFLHLLLNSQWMHDLVSGYANGTTVNMLPIDAVQKPMVSVPPRALLEAFDALALGLEYRREQAVRESRTLAASRETLLPKLISGETRVGDAERVVESVT